MQQIIESNEYFTRLAIRSNRILAGMVFYFQVAIIFLYGFFVLPTPTKPDPYSQQLFITIGVAILVLVGFGLIFSHGKNKLWSSLGFNLFITAITFQLYFLIAGFWTNVGISGSNKSLSWGGKLPAFLSNSNNLTVNTYGVTAVQALKCSLANAVTFAAISGRAGPLEAMIISLVGTVVYELNRQLVSRYSFDFGGTMTIFCFGGCFGSTVSLILYHCVQKRVFKQHRMRIAGNFSNFLTAIGSLFCWVFFPFLNLDIPITLILNYAAGLNTIHCISACVATTVSLTCMINGKIDLKDVVLSTVAGGVAAGSSVAMINNSLEALILGVGAAFVHVGLLQLDKLIRWRVVVENSVFYLFAVMGTLGGLISAVFAAQAAKDTALTSITSSGYIIPSSKDQLIGVGISVALGIISGLMVSPLICMMNIETDHDYYHDRAYWIIEQDGISQLENVQLSADPQSHQTQSEPETVYYKEVMINVPKSAIVDRYAYL